MVFEDADYESELNIKNRNGNFNMADENLNCTYKVWN